MGRETIGVLASGRGSNFQAILDHIKLEVLEEVEVGALISDSPGAGAISIAKKRNVPNYVIVPREDEERREYERRIHEVLKEEEVTLVVLAGFMRIVSPYLIKNYDENIMNIHPSLLPSFKGLDAQKKALEFGAKVSGCTVHYAWEEVDAGPIILQRAVPVKERDTVESLSNRILVQEHRAYSKAIQLHADGRLEIEGRRVNIDYGGGWKEKWKERQEAFIEYQKERGTKTEIYGDVFK